MSEPLLHEIPLANLLPIQRDVSFITYDGVFPTGPQQPVETVLYAGEIGDPDATYILFNGHHRSYRAHLLGESAVLGRTLTEDRHVLDATGPVLSSCGSIAQARQRYRNLRLKLSDSLSIATMEAWATDALDPKSRSTRLSAP